MTERTLLRGGLVADGIDPAPRVAEVLIDGAVIEAVIEAVPDRVPDRVPERAPAGIDARVVELEPGSVICPGFIDAHVHAEGPLLESGEVEGALAQGITTLVVGQDGSSWIGADRSTAGYLDRYFGPVNGRLGTAGGISVAGYRDRVAGRLRHNVAVLASHGTIRHNVAGTAPRPLDAAELARARRQVEEALETGAVGLSSGFDYVPSRFGDAAELAALTAPVAAAGRPYVSHLRGYGPTAAAGLAELIEVGAAAGVAVHASHLWARPADAEAAFAAADRAGVGLTYDMYPYRVMSSILAMMLLPDTLLARGPAAVPAALRDRATRRALLDRPELDPAALGRIVLGCLPPEHAALAGRTVVAAAGPAPPGEWVLDLLADTGLQVGAHLDRPDFAAGDADWLVEHPRHCAGSDGIYQGQHPHPRGFGAFARLARHYLDGGGEDRYHRLVDHLAGTAARAYGLTDRGMIAPGKAADLCVLGPRGVTDHAGYDTPRLLATGISHVFVNGTLVYADGRVLTGVAPGAVVDR